MGLIISKCGRGTLANHNSQGGMFRCVSSEEESPVGIIIEDGMRDSPRSN